MTRALALAAMLGATSACAYNIGFQPSLDGSRWQVAAINGIPMPQTAAYRVEFASGRLAGKLGCNSFNGAYTQGAETITLGPVAATKMACAEPAMSHESAGLAALAQPLKMIWTDFGKRLILKAPAGTIDLRRIG